MTISRSNAQAWLAKYREILLTLFGFLILFLAFFALSDLLKEIRSGDIKSAFRAIETRDWLLALCFTAISFSCLTLYDFFALKILGAKIPYRVVASTASVAYAISNTIGLSLLTGGSVRMRMYGRAGLSEADVARVIVLSAVTFWSGIFILFGLSLALEPAGIRIGGFALPVVLQWGVPGLIMIGLVGLLIWLGRKRRTLRGFGADLPLPPPRLAVAQLATAAIDLAASAAVALVLIPNAGIDLYPQFLAAYILALGVAVLTHSPGGLGVFEAMIFLLLPQVAKLDLAAGLIGYRLVYYLIPFAIALIALATSEGGSLRRHAAPVARFSQTLAVSLAPMAMAGLVFAGGAVLIITGAFPAVPDRVEMLLTILPPGLLDLSHFVASLFGTGLMFVAYGLYRRLDLAWLTSMGLLALGAVSALLRGFDYVEAGALALVLLLLYWTRPAFYRQSALTGERPGPGWILAIASVIVASIFIGSIAYKDVEYSNQLWWQIHPAGDAQRFLRASLGAAVVAILIAINRLSRPLRASPLTTLPPEVWKTALAKTSNTEAHLARTGDKFFLVSEAGDAFLMYRVRGRSFIAMGHPVGPRERWPELVWKLRELADRQGGRIAFYECGGELLPLVVDLGLGVMKLGEEAIVPLQDFTLDGKSRADLRHAINRMEREGVTFRIVQGDQVDVLLPELREISDEWLAAKKQREKQFSLGRFDRDYLIGEPMALVEHDGRILAFANLWTLPGHGELSLDLMRHRNDAPPGTMDFLFGRLMLWGRDQGYSQLSLGIAPLSGIENRRLAPVWAKIAGYLFRHGERLYGYAGLRRYKEKFKPQWRGRYFAAPRGLPMALALIDVTILVSTPQIISLPKRSGAASPESPAGSGGSNYAALREDDPASVASPESRIPIVD